MSKPKSPSLFSHDVRSFIESFADDIADGSAAIFAGAGLSVASGYVDWRGLMREIAADLGLDVDRETNLVAVAQYHLNERRNRTRINQKIIDEFSAGHKLTENHEVLAKLPIGTYWTTNYDRMIETALEASGKIVDVKHSVNQLKTTQKGRQATIYKMHGDVGDASNAVLTKDDYEGYFRDREPFVTALTGDLVSKTMLFIGFSFSDPNIDYVMSRIRVVLKSQPKQHYCILKRESRRSREKTSDFEYRKRQHDYFVKDLARIGIQALLIDDYSEITQILHAIESRYRSRTVFISGSAHDFKPWNSDDAATFIELISGGLIKDGFNVVTGFGLGVGASVIAGAMQELLRNPKKRWPNQLQAMPFPFDDGASPARQKLYRSHREEMIAKAGIAIFLFGNKREKGLIVPANGMQDEVEIAKKNGLHIVAAGGTGWVAHDVASDLAGTLGNRSKKFQSAFRKANSSKIDVPGMANAVLSMVREFRD